MSQKSPPVRGRRRASVLLPDNNPEQAFFVEPVNDVLDENGEATRPTPAQPDTFFYESPTTADPFGLF